MSSEKTHVLLQPVIISQLGRCEAGTPIAQDDVDGDTWNWLTDNRCVKSIADIEAEADSGAEVTTTVSPNPDVTTPVSRTSRTGTSKPKPQPKPKSTDTEPQHPGPEAPDTEPAQPNEPNAEADVGNAG